MKINNLRFPCGPASPSSFMKRSEGLRSEESCVECCLQPDAFLPPLTMPNPNLLYPDKSVDQLYKNSKNDIIIV